MISILWNQINTWEILKLSYNLDITNPLKKLWIPLIWKSDLTLIKDLIKLELNLILIKNFWLMVMDLFLKYSKSQLKISLTIVMLIINMDFSKLKKIWKQEVQLSVLLSRDCLNKLISLKIKDILKKQNFMLKLSIIKIICLWGPKLRKMLKMITNKFGKNKLQTESKRIENGNCKTCMHL